MKDQNKTKEQLINELVELRRRISELEALETKRIQAEESLRKAKKELERRVAKHTAELAKANARLQRDINERKWIEEELRGTKEFLEKVIETTVDGIMIVDLNGNMTAVNSALKEMTGMSEEELIGKHASILIKEDEEVRKRFRERTTELFKKGYISYELALKRKDGKEVEIEYNASLIKDEKGDYIAGVSVWRDVTKRKKAEKEISEAKEFLENLFRTSVDAILVTDPQGNITMVNEAIKKMTGYSRDELLGKHSSILTPPDKELRSKVVQDLKILFEKGRVYGHEMIWQRKDGQHIFVEFNKSLIKDKGGQVIGGVNFARDITEKKKVESMLIQTEKLKSLGELAGGVAHDFNNVLAAILGRAQLLEMNLESFSGGERRKIYPLLKQGLQVIERAATDGAETVRRIQEFSRIRADDKEFIPVDLNELLDHALNLTRARWKDEAEFKGIKIRIKKELPLVPTVMGKPSELKEVLTNLINNALDAMPQGGRINIKTFKEDNWVCLEMEDTGIGIPPHILDNIFDPFYTTKGPQATGLGMSVSYGIITRHRGTISVDSKEGKGTTFTIKIPIKGVGEIKDKEVKELPEKEKKAAILIIEDEEDICNLLYDIMTTDGHKVTIASDGKNGIEKFKKGEFDLVFTDLGMPGMSGWEVASLVKKLNLEVIVAIITGWGIQLDRDELEKSDVDFVVNKPFKVDQILKLTQKAMELKDKVKREREGPE